jgi:hypothetical protein
MITSAGQVSASMLDRLTEAVASDFLSPVGGRFSAHAAANQRQAGREGQTRRQVRALHLTESLKQMISSWIPNPLAAHGAEGLVCQALLSIQQAADLMSFAFPIPENCVPWREMQNKIEAFELFEYADSILHLREDLTSDRLPKYLARTRELDAYRSLWIAEGLGHDYAETGFRGPGEASLLNGQDIPALGAHFMVPLHAGMGLSLASRALAGLASQSSAAQVRSALKSFLALCRHHSRTGYVEVAYEALGLVARQLHPLALPQIDRQLRELNPDLRGYLWHGVGRALYFDPTNILPSTASIRALEMAQTEPPHEIGRANAISGLAWAVTLVNIRHPEILERFLEMYGRAVPEREAFSNGVNSALGVWRDFAGETPYADGFVRHGPRCRSRQVVRLWQDLVSSPYEQSIHRHSFLRCHDRVGELFHYQRQAGDELPPAE